MKKTILLLAAVCLTFATQAEETYKVLKINKGTDVLYEIKLADFDSLTFETRQLTLITANEVSFNMVFVQGGTFTMGSTDTDKLAGNDEKPQHQVTVSDFYIGETVVTQALWYAVMGQKPTAEGSQWSEEFGLGDNYPAYFISWNDCQAFIDSLNKLTGKTFRMPTEAEWEYAARGGNKSQGYLFSGSNELDDVAWHAGNIGENPTTYYGLHEVGTRVANELGLYDMSGNVWEWCSDWDSKTYYTEEAQTNPTGPETGTQRAMRGGCSGNGEQNCRVSERMRNYPAEPAAVIGLRLALVP